MSDKSSPEVPELPDEIPRVGMAASGVTLLFGIAGGHVFWLDSGPSFMWSLAFFGAGLGGFSLFNTLRVQTEMGAYDFLPYLFWIGLSLCLFVFGVGYGYVDFSIGLAFYVLWCLTMFILGQFFHFHAPKGVTR